MDSSIDIKNLLNTKELERPPIKKIKSKNGAKSSLDQSQNMIRSKTSQGDTSFSNTSDTTQIKLNKNKLKTDDNNITLEDGFDLDKFNSNILKIRGRKEKIGEQY